MTRKPTVVTCPDSNTERGGDLSHARPPRIVAAKDSTALTTP